MEQTILILNGSGTISKLVAINLINRKVSFSTASRNEKALYPNTPHYAVDLVSGEGLTSALKNIKKILLVTPDHNHQTQMELNVLNEAVKANVKHIVKISAINAEKEDYLLGKIHHQIEKQIQASTISWTFLRPAAFMQNFITYYLDDIRSNQLLQLPCGDGKVNFIDARDVADIATLALLEKGFGNRSFNMFGPESLSYGDTASILSEELGVKIGYEAISPKAYERKIGSGDTFKRIMDLYNYYRNSHASGNVFDLRQYSDRSLRSFSAFIQEHLQHFK